MTKGLLGYPAIASLGITPYVIDFKGGLPGSFTYTRNTTDTVLSSTGEVITRAPNQYIQDFDSLGNALGARVTQGVDFFLWQPTPAVYTLYVEAEDRTINIRTVVVGVEGLVLLATAGKTHIRRVGVNRPLDLDPPPVTQPDPVLPLVFVQTTAQVDEGADLTFAVSKTGAGACSVSIVLTDGTTSLSDYGVLSSTTVSFLSGDTSKFVTLPIVADFTSEGDETLFVQLVNPQGCQIGNDLLEVTIRDTSVGAPVLPVVSIPTALEVEEGRSYQIVITKTGTGACSVRMNSASMTATGVNNVDYIGLPDSLFEFGEAPGTQSWTLVVNSDNIVEPDEQFRMELKSPIGCTIANSQCLVTIKDRTVPTDPPPATGYTIVQSYNDDNLGGIGKPYFFVDDPSDNVQGTGNRGTLRWAFQSNRLVLSEIQGRTRLASNLQWTDKDNVSYCGFTGPGPHVLYSDPGFIIKIRGRRLAFFDLIHERGYSGSAESTNNGDVFQILDTAAYKPSKIKFVRCYGSGGQDESFQFYHTRDANNPKNAIGQEFYSLHYCISHNPLDQPSAFNSTFKNNDNATQHGFNFLIGGFVENVDMQRCLSTNARQRNPRVASPGARHLIANNAVVNWGYAGMTLQSEAPGANNQPTLNDNSLIYEISFIGNIGISGPQTSNPWYITQWGTGRLGVNSKVHVAGNFAKRGLGASVTPVATLGNEDMQNNNGRTHLAGFVPRGTRQDPLTQVQAFSSMEEGLLILENNLGPFPKLRKANPGLLRGVDQAIDQMMQRSTPRIVNHQNEGPGFSNPAFVRRPLTGDLAPPADHTNVEQVKAWLKFMEEKVAYV